MGFKPRFKKADIRAMMFERKRNIDNAILQRLNLIGNEFVKMARSKTAMQGGFGDITGNLRSSIGFVVVDHGSIVESDFEQTLQGSEGMNKAKQLTRELSGNFMDGFALIVVAGMEYAAAVENRHHKDVITGSSLIAEAMLKQALNRIKSKVSGL